MSVSAFPLKSEYYQTKALKMSDFSSHEFFMIDSLMDYLGNTKYERFFSFEIIFNIISGDLN